VLAEPSFAVERLRLELVAGETHEEGATGSMERRETGRYLGWKRSWRFVIPAAGTSISSGR